MATQIFNSKHSFKALAILATFAATSVMAQVKSKAPVYEVPSSQTATSPKISNFALGFQRYSFSRNGFLVVHGMAELSPDSLAGFGFGFDQDGDTLLFVGDYRKLLATYENSALFFEGTAGFLKATADYFVLGGRLGFLYALTPKLKVDFAWGLEVMITDGDTKFALTQSNDFAGKFGMHWHF